MFVKIDNTFFSTTKNKILVNSDTPYKVLNIDKIIEFYYRKKEIYLSEEKNEFYEIIFCMDDSCTLKIQLSSLKVVEKIVAKITGSSFELE